MKSKNLTPIIIAYYYDHGKSRRFEKYASKLIDDCKRYNYDHDIVCPDGIADFYANRPETVSRKHWINRYKPTFIKQMLYKHDRPVIYLDCDGSLNCEFEWSKFDGCDIGYDLTIRGRERNDEYAALVSGIYFNNTNVVKTFIDVWEYKCYGLFNDVADHTLFINTLRDIGYKNNIIELKRVRFISHENILTLPIENNGYRN